MKYLLVICISPLLNRFEILQTADRYKNGFSQDLKFRWISDGKLISLQQSLYEDLDLEYVKYSIHLRSHAGIELVVNIAMNI